jgi:multidrug efflux system membrane fusion protein
MSRWKSRWKIALVVVIALVIVVVAVRVLHKPSKAGRAGAADANAPVPVTVVPAVSKNVPVYLTANGTVQALNTVTVHPQVAGQLLKLTFTEGTEVKKGEVLAEIDPRTYQAQYDQAVARERQDQAQLATARSNVTRSEGLIAKHYVSEADPNTQRNTVKQLEATVAAGAANARDLKVQLDHTKVKAPIDGLAGIRMVDPGNVVSTTDGIVVLTQLHPINVMFPLPAQNLDLVRAAQAEAPLPVSALDSADSHVIAGDGKLTVIDNQINPNSGSFQLKSEFPNTRGELWPGQYVSVRMQVNTVKNGLVVPTEAVQRGPDGDYVYLLQAGNTVKMQPVTVAGEADTTHQMIGSGLKPGDKVVTEGQFRLKPGSKVEPLAPGQVPKAPTAAQVKKAAQSGGRGRH